MGKAEMLGISIPSVSESVARPEDSHEKRLLTMNFN